ncbi:MAG: response regulator [Alphaproteobacteria bacterium]
MKITSIMVVDDNDGDHFLTQAIIEEFDSSIEIFQAYDGEEALEILDSMENQPSIILLDINMPRMNGFEFLEEYGKRENQSRVIAMLTSSDQGRDKEKAMTYNCVQKYFEKPLDIEDLESLKTL